MSTKQRAALPAVLCGLALTGQAPAAAEVAPAAPGAAGTAASAETPAGPRQQEERRLEELRDTVVNLLQALVDKGVITREQADAMVKSAQQKAAATVAAAQKQAQEEQGAVRVPYVPEIVKDQIREELATEITPAVKQQVVEEVTAKNSLYAALPEWMQHVTFASDIRTRFESDQFDSTNARDFYLDFNQINTAGGIAKAGSNALLNTTENENRLRLRARFGFDATLGTGWSMGMRLASGSTPEILASTNQSLGTFGQGYTTTLNNAWLRWTGSSADGRQAFTALAGKFDNPWVSTDLIWYNDLTFEGVITNYKFNLASQGAPRHDLFLTLGGLPLSNYSPFSSNYTTQQKWLLAAQLGADFTTESDSRVRFAAAYYDYLRMVGERNAYNSTLLNWTVPGFVQKGNTMFDISNTSDPTVNLFAYASNFRIVDLTSVSDLHLLPRYSLGVTLEALRNIGWNTSQVQWNTGHYVAPKTSGYRADLSWGTSAPPAFGSWRAYVGYRYLQRDAVVDAFNDEDFHLGGTDAKGYTLMFDYSFNPHVYVRLKYLAANAIDDPPLTIDVFQLDFNARF